MANDPVRASLPVDVNIDPTGSHMILRVLGIEIENDELHAMYSTDIVTHAPILTVEYADGRRVVSWIDSKSLIESWLALLEKVR